MLSVFPYSLKMFRNRCADSPGTKEHHYMRDVILNSTTEPGIIGKEDTKRPNCYEQNLKLFPVYNVSRFSTSGACI